MKVLLIEDEPDLLNGIARALRKAGYAVDLAADGEEGLYKGTSDDYDAIVLDVMLPALDGWEVLRRLRASRSTPVLMLTARDRTADRVRGLDAGADDYMIKPFEVTELLARLRALIRRSASRARSFIEVRDVRIDPATRTVTQAGVPVPLTPREFAILEYLARHPGEVVTRTTLHEHVVDENDSSISNLIDVHVFNLRRKLGHDFIVTRRGHGYCIGT